MSQKRISAYRCPECQAPSCGDDTHTVTRYRGPERAVGDRLKVILLQVYDMSEIDNLQLYEIKALISALVDEHFVEEDELNP